MFEDGLSADEPQQEDRRRLVWVVLFIIGAAMFISAVAAMNIPRFGGKKATEQTVLTPGCDTQVSGACSSQGSSNDTTGKFERLLATPNSVYDGLSHYATQISPTGGPVYSGGTSGGSGGGGYCGGSCSTSSDCAGGMSCFAGVCWNAQVCESGSTSTDGGGGGSSKHRSGTSSTDGGKDGGKDDDDDHDHEYHHH
jgi:hypothetical protein